MPVARLEEDDDTAFGYSPGRPPSGNSGFSAPDYTAANASVTFPRLSVDDLPPTYTMPADAQDRIIIETARTVMGLSALIDLKIAEVNDAIARLEAADKAIAGEMRGGIESNKQTVQSLKTAGELSVRSTETISATLKAQGDATASLKTTVAELAGLQNALRTISSTLTQHEQQAARRHQESQAATKEDGKATREAVQNVESSIAASISAANKDVTKNLSNVNQGLLTIHQAVDDTTAQRITDAKNSVLHLVNSATEANTTAHESAAKELHAAEQHIVASVGAAEARLHDHVTRQADEVMGATHALRMQAKRNTVWLIVLIILILVVALLSPAIYNVGRSFFFKQ